MSDLYLNIRNIIQGKRKEISSKQYDGAVSDIMRMICGHYGCQCFEKDSECDNCGRTVVSEKPYRKTTKSRIYNENIDVDFPAIGSEEEDDKNKNTE